MMSIDSLIGCICTETVVDGKTYQSEYSFYETRTIEGDRNLPPIRNQLRLVKESDGLVEWRDD